MAGDYDPAHLYVTEGFFYTVRDSFDDNKSMYTTFIAANSPEPEIVITPPLQAPAPCTQSVPFDLNSLVRSLP